ncbi:nucleoside hydrolase [Rhodococcus rhodochrous]|uniref:nucleoside hydrolase n=1 Tax=Rhodococcus rhodochrous TaxID=1829 RepID=UPI0024BA48D0|nr:nucleoside hydrolase [Rhodococcus rhodochrous]MDJ0397466.1 nucleoside hydrolase [Rhodococcus rhodochrous]
MPQDGFVHVHEPDVPAARTRLIVDVDTGIDDALTLLYLVASPEAEIVAALCTAGNVPVDQVTANTLSWLEVCGRPDIEVAAGSQVPLVAPLMTTEDTHGPQGIGYAELPAASRSRSARSAAQAWVDLTREHPGELTGLVTGPLTNLALALRIDPELPSRLRRLVIMGGCFHHPGNTTPTSEWNVAVDPEAAKVVFDAFSIAPPDRRPIVCPLDVTESIEMHPEHVARIGDVVGVPRSGELSPDAPRGTRSTADVPLVRHISDALRFYMEFHRDQGLGFLAHVHDPFAAAVALGTVPYTSRPATVDVELDGRLTRGTTVADLSGIWQRTPNADIVAGTRPAEFFDHFVERVGSYIRDLNLPPSKN